MTRTHRHRFTFAAAAAACLAASGTAGANNDLNTSFRAGSISLPSLDDDSSSDASVVGVNQGRASYRVPIVAPPGKPGVEPELALVYTGTRREGVLGAGWSLALPAIRVKTSGRNGQPDYGVVETYLGLSGEELLEAGTLADVDGDGVDETVFREERDLGYRRYVELSAGGWRIDFADGRKLTAGTSSSAQIVRSGASYTDWIAAWLPETLEDPLGNQLVYTWQTAQDIDASTVSPTARYLASIRYACQACASATYYQEVDLSYARRSALGLGTVIDGSAGFVVETELYLSSITTSSAAADTGDARTYTLGYDASATRMLLSSVDIAGGSDSLPQITFGYTDGDAPATVPQTLSSYPAVGFKSGVQPMDVDEDGRVDIVDLSALSSAVWYANDASATSAAFDATGATIASPPGATPTSSDVSLEDHDRDLGIDVFDLGGNVVYAHTATGWDSGTATTLPSVTLSSDTVRIDVNRDGYVDLVDTSSTSQWSIYLNDGAGDYTTETIGCVTASGSTDPTPQVAGSVLHASDDGVLFGDVNGDGLVDVVYLDSTGHGYAFYGRGRGCWGLLSEDGHSSGRAYDPLTVTARGAYPTPGAAALADVDGDGMADLIEVDSSAGQVGVWLMVPGTGWTDVVSSGPWSETLTTTNGCRAADFDHDGITELLCSAGWSLYDFADTPPMLLASVDNGLGLSTALSYTTSARLAATASADGDPWTTNVAAAIPVVSSMSEDDNRGHVLVRSFEYRDAYYMADSLEDRFEFVGFGQIDESSIPYLESGGVTAPDPADSGVLTRTYYDVGDTDWMLRGRVTCKETWPGASTPTADGCGAATGALERTEYELSSTMDTTYGFSTVTVDAIDDNILEGAASGEQLRTERSYDDYGNVTQEIRWGRYDAADTGYGDDELVIETDYVTDTTTWNLRLPARVQRGGLDATSATPAVDPISIEYRLYDGAGSWDASLTSVSQGLVTETQRWDYDPYTGTSSTTTTSTATYTAEGMPDQVTDADGVVTDYDYDIYVGLFATQRVVDSSGLALTTSQTTDSRHGGVTVSVAADGAITRAGYDGLGRMTSIVRPGDTVAHPTISRTYTDGSPESTVTDVARDGTSDGLTTTTTVDGRGAVVCKTRESVAGKVDVTAQTDRSARGYGAMTLRPYRALSCATVTVSVSSGTGSRSSAHAHESFTVDGLGRRTELVHSSDGSSRAWTYDVLETSEYDEEDTDASSNHYDTPRVTARDGRDRIVSVTESHSYADDDPGTHTTTYSYTALDKLASVVDASGTTIYQAEYDSRGLPVWSQDADRGETVSSYDSMGRLSSRTDARGEAQEMAYDAAGRVETVTTSAGTVTYHYDTHYLGGVATAACHTTGRLAWVEDLAGRELRCYTNRGLASTIERTIDSYGASYLTTTRTYDSMDRVRTLTHPDGTELIYRYGHNGLVRRIVIDSSGARVVLVRYAGYAPDGQPKVIRLGNGVVRRRWYDDRERLSRDRAVLGSTWLQDLRYTLDGVGDVTAIADVVGGASASYEYDDLYRLAEASGTRYGGDTATYRYDRLGNLTDKTFTDTSSDVHVGTLVYGDSTRVHAVTAIGSQTLSYDAAGNVSDDGTYAFDYTPSGMLSDVTSGGSPVLSFEYDHTDRRIAKTTAAGDSVFTIAPAHAELRTVSGTSTWIKYVDVGGHPVARIEGRFSTGTEADHVFYLTGDNVDSPTLVLDTSGAVVERADTHPWGEQNQLSLVAAGTEADYVDPTDATTKLTRRFQSRELDAELGTYDFGARIYDPRLGRFLTPDSVVPEVHDSQSWNRYAFVRNNPLRFVDPSGHAPAATDQQAAAADTSASTSAAVAPAASDAAAATAPPAESGVTLSPVVEVKQKAPLFSFSVLGTGVQVNEEGKFNAVKGEVEVKVTGEFSLLGATGVVGGKVTVSRDTVSKVGGYAAAVGYLATLPLTLLTEGQIAPDPPMPGASHGEPSRCYAEPAVPSDLSWQDPYSLTNDLLLGADQGPSIYDADHYP